MHGAFHAFYGFTARPAEGQPGPGGRRGRRRRSCCAAATVPVPRAAVPAKAAGEPSAGGRVGYSRPLVTPPVGFAPEEIIREQ